MNIQVRDSKNNVLAKPKDMKEAERLARSFLAEKKEKITVWTTEPVRTGTNFYRYGYNCRLIFEPEFDLGEDALIKSFSNEIDELYTVNWSETDGSDVEKILENNLIGGISSRADFWLKQLDSGLYTINMFQKAFIRQIIQRKGLIR